ncbi:MAG: hypothetical protein EA378_11475 [Phycisphaerales bacterium]|nr:MAG: hypothetical protein EA378_11475 [Phycisphaerales bacterium]
MTALGGSRFVVGVSSRAERGSGVSWAAGWAGRGESLLVRWAVAGRLLGLGDEGEGAGGCRGMVTVGWRFVAGASAGVCRVEPVLPPGLRGLNGRTPRPAWARVVGDGSFVHLDAIRGEGSDDERRPEGPSAVIRVGGEGLELVYARSDLFTRLGIAGGRYESLGVVIAAS